MAGYTGSPTELTCRSCHNTYGLNSGSGTMIITTTPSMTADQYMPNTTYTVSVTMQQSGINLFGFGVEILDVYNANAGTINILNSAETKTVSFGGRINVVHQHDAGIGPGNKTFSFEWTSPASGDVGIYTSGIASNQDLTVASDYAYSTYLILTNPFDGIKENTLNSKISINPNPVTSGLLHVNFVLEETTDVKIELLSLNGNSIIKLTDEKQLAGEHKLNLVLPDNIEKGIYLLNIKLNHKNFNKRIIIK